MDSVNANEEKWYVARTRHGQELSIKRRLDDRGIENFVPTTQKVSVRAGARVLRDAPLIPNIVFLHASKHDALALPNEYGLPVYYMVDKASKSLMEVPERQMSDFMMAVAQNPDSLSFEPQMRLGARVKIICGPLTGMEGYVQELPTRTYVVVTIGNLMSAKVKVGKDFLKVIR